MRKRATLGVLAAIWALGGYSAYMGFHQAFAWMGWTMLALVGVNFVIAMAYFTAESSLPGKGNYPPFLLEAYNHDDQGKSD